MSELLVKDFIGKRGKSGDIGIEIEVEAHDELPDIKTKEWTSKKEGSLRVGGKEYVSNGPLVISSTPRHLKFLSDSLSKCKIIHDSPRASVHMHLNVMYKTPVQYWTQVCAYWLTENLLMDFCGEYRKGNSFCLRLLDAEGVLRYAHNDLKQSLPFASLHNDAIRYCGQNLKATYKFGSIEYRGMEFTIDPNKLYTWANQLYLLGLNTKDFANPARFMDEYFLNDGSKEFLSKIFDKDFVSTITKSDNWKDRLEINEGVICELAYVHDWDRWERNITQAYKDVGGVKRKDAYVDPFGRPGNVAQPNIQFVGFDNNLLFMGDDD